MYRAEIYDLTQQAAPGKALMYDCTPYLGTVELEVSVDLRQATVYLCSVGMPVIGLLGCLGQRLRLSRNEVSLLCGEIIEVRLLRDERETIELVAISA